MRRKDEPRFTEPVTADDLDVYKTRRIAAKVILSAFYGREVDFRFLCGEKGDIDFWLQAAGIEQQFEFIMEMQRLRRKGTKLTKKRINEIKKRLA